MSIDKCNACCETKELEELVVESEMYGSCQEYNLGWVCKECREDRVIVKELLEVL